MLLADYRAKAHSEQRNYRCRWKVADKNALENPTAPPPHGLYPLEMATIFGFKKWLLLTKCHCRTTALDFQTEWCPNVIWKRQPVVCVKKGKRETSADKTANGQLRFMHNFNNKQRSTLVWPFYTNFHVKQNYGTVFPWEGYIKPCPN